MSAAEAREFAAHPRPDLELDVRFSGQGAGGLTAREPGSARESGSEDGNGLNSVPRGVRRNQVVDLGGVKVELRAQNTGVLAKLTREYFRDPLRVADGNRNGYVEPAEFAGLDLVNADFGAVDFNENGEIVAAEVSAYVEQELLLQQSTVVISVDNELKSLFEVLDGDSDRRLTPREFLRGAGEFERLDVNGNRELAESELLARYKLRFGLGAARLTAQLLPGTAPRSGGRAKATPLPAAPGSGPLWFRRMDRNRDGDVAWREFLGPREAFARIDADGDGLIDAGEAEGR
jgi:hypothetical protein